MSLRILRRLPNSCALIHEQCQYANPHIAGGRDLHGTCLPSNPSLSSANGLLRRNAGVQMTGPRHYCSSGQTPHHHPSGRLQELLEESSDPNVIDGEDLVYWEQPPHRTNPLYKNPEQQAEEAAKGPTRDARFASIVLFPGSLSGTKGLVSRKKLQLPIVQEMFSAASEILGFDLQETCLRGSFHDLSRQQIQQPAVLVASLAAVERLQHEQPAALEMCTATAGYGVGEVTALTFAGAFSFEDAVRLVKLRAEAMHLAADVNPGGAVRVHCVAACRLSLVCSAAVEHCKRAGVEDPHCSVAAQLYPSCYVLAGSSEALSFLEKHSTELKLKRIVRLPDCGAFHTDLMRPASNVIEQALQLMPVIKPAIRVLSSFTDREYVTPEHVRRLLPLQVQRPVLWQQVLGRLYHRPQGMQYPTTYECGPGDGLLSKMLRINNEKAGRNIRVVAA